ncbi:hypothetical protein AB0J82_07585 [Asanoa sp. NPDC049518]|uniref:hypothetical protein n=1 Tax=unclassified Asanoa TaxID=2685164 RepID=UPI00344382C5
MRRLGVVLAGSVLVLAGACSGDREVAPPAACSSPVNNEMRGTGSLWALFFPTQGQTAPVVAGAEVKIVWKIGGEGDFTVSATGPDGAQAKLAWGPTGHGSSTWERPGTEYGTGLVFPTPGCWTITAARANGERGELRLTVA